MQKLQIPASGSCTLAYLGKKGELLNAETGDSLPRDWCGTAFGRSTFFCLGREKNERSFHGLNAQTYLEAKKEAEIVKALNVDIEEVFDDTLNAYFSAFPACRGEPLEQALRNHGLTRVVNVTGHSPERFFPYASDMLSPVFGIAPDHDQIDDVLRARNMLVLAVVAKAMELIGDAGR